MIDCFDEVIDMRNAGLLEYFFEHTEVIVTISRGHLYLVLGELKTHRPDVLRNVHDSQL